MSSQVVDYPGLIAGIVNASGLANLQAPEIVDEDMQIIRMELLGGFNISVLFNDGLEGVVDANEFSKSFTEEFFEVFNQKTMSELLLSPVGNCIYHPNHCCDPSNLLLADQLHAKIVSNLKENHE